MDTQERLERAGVKGVNAEVARHLDLMDAAAELYGVSKDLIGDFIEDYQRDNDLMACRFCEKRQYEPGLCSHVCWAIIEDGEPRILDLNWARPRIPDACPRQAVKHFTPKGESNDGSDDGTGIERAAQAVQRML